MRTKRNCNLELNLLPPPYHFPDHSDWMERSGSSRTSQMEEPQKMTIFYNGRICVSDVTHLQAKDIMMLAKRGMELDLRSSTSPNWLGLQTPNSSTRLHHHQPHQHKGPSLPLYSPNAEASMKRSLQRFLQKRKDRIEATSPYH